MKAIENWNYYSQLLNILNQKILEYEIAKNYGSELDELRDKVWRLNESLNMIDEHLEDEF